MSSLQDCRTKICFTFLKPFNHFKFQERPQRAIGKHLWHSSPFPALWVSAATVHWAADETETAAIRWDWPILVHTIIFLEKQIMCLENNIMCLEKQIMFTSWEQSVGSQSFPLKTHCSTMFNHWVAKCCPLSTLPDSSHIFHQLPSQLTLTVIIFYFHNNPLISLIIFFFHYSLQNYIDLPASGRWAAKKSTSHVTGDRGICNSTHQSWQKPKSSSFSVIDVAQIRAVCLRTPDFSKSLYVDFCSKPPQLGTVCAQRAWGESFLLRRKIGYWLRLRHHWGIASSSGAVVWQWVLSRTHDIYALPIHTWVCSKGYVEVYTLWWWMNLRRR